MLKKLSLVLSLCLAFSVMPNGFASAGSGLPIYPAKPVFDDACSLPAPSSLWVTDVGSTYISVAWTAVSGASQYRVKVKDLTIGSEINDQLVSGTTFTQTGLVGGHEYRFRVYSVCSNGDTGEAFTELTQRTIIIDLIVYASDYGNKPPQYECHGTQGPVACNFLHSAGYEFWIEVRHTVNGVTERARYDAIVESSGNVSLGLVSPTTGNYTLLTNYLMTANQNGAYMGQEPVVPAETVYVRLNNSLSVCYFTMGHSGSTGYIYAWPISGYEFWVLNPNDPPTGGTSRVQAGHTLTESAFAAADLAADRQNPAPLNNTTVVNPFSTTLQALLPAASETPVTLRLYSLDGRLAGEREFPEGSTQCELPAADLPRGLYLLRIESGGQVETFKVIKTE